MVATGKGGVLVGLDRTTGDELWRTPVGHHENDELTELSGPTLVAPGTFGGVITPPATADGVVYVAAIDAPVTLEPNATAYFGASPASSTARWSRSTPPPAPCGGRPRSPAIPSARWRW